MSRAHTGRVQKNAVGEGQNVAELALERRKNQGIFGKLLVVQGMSRDLAAPEPVWLSG